MTPATGNRKTILIVDDQPGNVHVLAAALTDVFEIRFATSAARALELVREAPVDLVLLDVSMPDMNGFDVCRRIKDDEATRSIPVIFVTAREEVEDEARGFEVGGVDYITKPIRPLIVQARVRTHLELKEHRDRLEELSWLDPLTGIANRRRFDEHLSREWSRASRAGRPITIAIVDIDEFKKYNDHFGHPRGDQCLRRVARVLSDSLRRPGDLVARYGGEEFAMVLPETDGPGARGLIREILRMIDEENIEHPESSCSDRVSISVGAASVVPSQDDEASWGVAEADRLLYQAKQQGRNRGVQRDLQEDMAVGIDPRESGRAETGGLNE